MQALRTKASIYINVKTNWMILKHREIWRKLKKIASRDLGYTPRGSRPRNKVVCLAETYYSTP